MTTNLDTTIESKFNYSIADPNKCPDNGCISTTCCDFDENFMTLLYQVRIPLSSVNSSAISNNIEQLITKIMNIDVQNAVSFSNNNIYPDLVSSFAKAPDDNTITVDVMVRYRLVRVSKKHVKGKILYSTTLLPGEKARIFASSAHTDSTYNASTKNREYSQSTSAEGSFMNAIQNSMTNHAYNASSSQNTQKNSSNSSWNAGGSAGLNLGIVTVGGGGGGGGGSSDFSSAIDMSSQFVDSIQSATSQSAISVSASRTTNIRESETNTNIQTETNASVGAYTRELYNANKSCPVTYQFRSIDKCMEVRLELANVGFRFRVPDSIDSFNPIPQSRPVLVNIKPAIVNGYDIDALKIVKNRLLLDNISGASDSSVRFSTQSTSNPETGNGPNLFQRFASAVTGNVASTVQTAPITNNGDTVNLTFVPLTLAQAPVLNVGYLQNSASNTVVDKINKLQWFAAFMTLMIASRMTCTSADKDVIENGSVEDKKHMIECLKKVLSSPIKMGNTLIFDFVRDCWAPLTADTDVNPDEQKAYEECNKCRGLISWSKDVRLPSDGVTTDSSIGSSVYEDFEIDTKNKLVDLKIKETRSQLLSALAKIIENASTSTTLPDPTNLVPYIDMYKNLEGHCCTDASNK